MSVIYYIKNGSLHFGRQNIFSEIELYISPGDKVCLIGNNGCGKSSLMKVISGNYTLDSGEIFKDSRITIDYLKQDIETTIESTIYDFILQDFNDISHDRYQIDIILEHLELDGTKVLRNCSGGQLRKAFLAKVLVLQPDILLLDEPTNHLDIKTIQWLEAYVQSYKGAVICISHDRAFLNNVTNKIWWLDRGVLRKSSKGFKYFDEWQDLILEQEEAINRKLNKKLNQENDWLNAGVTARRKRNQKRLSDLKALRNSISQHSSNLDSAKKQLQSKLVQSISKTKFIIEMESVSFAYESKLIINNFSLRVQRGEKIGIIGANGTGKSTFLKLVTKKLQPSSGSIKYGTNLEITEIDQHKTDIRSEDSLQKTLCPNGGDQVFLADGTTMHVAGYLKKFLFDPKLLSSKVSTLSGGEVSRLLLARALIDPGNLLILDEPTNDLDMNSLEVLLEILSIYEGTLILVSHDRDFLNRLVTRTLVFNSNTIVDITGGYEDYEKTINRAPHLINKVAIKQDSQRATSPEIATKSKTSNKLSYKDQRLLETIPSEIDQLENEVKKLENILVDANLYLRNPDEFNKVTNKLSATKNQIDELVNAWLLINDTTT